MPNDGIPMNGLAIRTQQEVADILTDRGTPITRGGVYMAEQSAFKKLRLALMDLAIDELGIECDDHCSNQGG